MKSDILASEQEVNCYRTEYKLGKEKKMKQNNVSFE